MSPLREDAANGPANNPSAALAVRTLRRRTTGRALQFYTAWLRRAVGLTTLVYLVGWFVVLLLSGLELLPAPAEPLALPPAALIEAAIGLALLLPLIRRRTPPVVLDRRDLYRLGLAPVAPRYALRWPFLRGWGLRASLGALLGLGWWVVASTWFAQATPWSALGLALLLVTHLNLQWLRYATSSRDSGTLAVPLLAGTVIVLAGVSVLVPNLGLGAPLYTSSALSLGAPLLLAGFSSWRVHASLAERYPARFAAQCFVLGELNAIRTLGALAAFAGTDAGVDEAERARLLAQLHDRPGLRVPKRTLAPPQTPSAWRALAWRTRLTLLRRSRLQTALTLLQLGAAGFALAFASGSLLTLFLAAGIAGSVFAKLIGPGVDTRLLPITPRARTVGRVVPGLVLSCLVFSLTLGGAALLGALAWPSVLAALTLPPLGLVLLERYAHLIGAAPRRLEASFVATLLALVPLFVLTLFGLSALVVPVQLGLALLLLQVD